MNTEIDNDDYIVIDLSFDRQGVFYARDREEAQEKYIDLCESRGVVHGNLRVLIAA